MLQLPHTPIRQVFYASVIFELCRAESMTFPKALGSSVKILFNRLEYMDAECINRLWSWFSHHLSNFGFQWDWKAWDDIISLDLNHPQVCFVRETFEKQTRLSYYERIKSLIPEEFQKLMSPTPPGPHFECADPSNPLHEKAKVIVNALRGKKSVDEVKSLLDQFKEELEGVDEQERVRKERYLFTQCLLLVGSKSFSHILNVIERYLDILRAINTTPEARLHSVQIVASFWKNNSQVKLILKDITVCTNMGYSSWVFSWINY